MRRRRADGLLAVLLVLGASSAVPAQDATAPPAEQAPAATPAPTPAPGPAEAAPAPAPETPVVTPAPVPETSTSGTDLREKVEEYRSLGDTLRRPSGEVTVTADRAEWQQAGVMKYSGDVTLSVDTLQLRGDALELKQFEGGAYQAHLTGNPARLTDAGADGAPPIHAYAKRLDYDARTSLAELSGSAVLTRGADRITGENIRYDAAARRVQAAGGNSGQVRIVIQPPPAQKGSQP